MGSLDFDFRAGCRLLDRSGLYVDAGQTSESGGSGKCTSNRVIHPEAVPDFQGLWEPSNSLLAFCPSRQLDE